MVDHSPGIHIGQRLASQAAAFFLLIEPCGQGLLDDPVLGAFQPLGNFIDTLGKLDGDVRGDGSGFGAGSHSGLLLYGEIRVPKRRRVEGRGAGSAVCPWRFVSY